MFSKIHVLYKLYIYMYTEAFLLCSIKAWERTPKKKDWETGKHTLMKQKHEALNMK